MYSEHFGFKAKPFSIAPDPRYLYMSERHREALAHLLYGIRSEGGFVLLTGEVGTGKTTICRCLLEQIPDDTDIALILNPKLTVSELLATICEEFGIDYPSKTATNKVFIDLLNAYLLDAHARGRQAVLIIDEAQNLSAEVLEQLRLLTNLETNERKLLQIIMVGQPELKEMLARPELRQLAQRVTARYHLDPLTESEVAAYVGHRLRVAGGSAKLFTAGAVARLARLSGGVPRLINVICDRALLGTYAQERDRVTAKTLTKAGREVLGEIGRRRSPAVFGWSAAVLALLVLGLLAVGTYYRHPLLPWTGDSAAALPEAGDRPEVVLTAPAAGRVPAPAVPPTSAIQWPAGLPLEKSREFAYQALFKQWEMAYEPGENGYPCQYAETVGLRCLQERGGFKALLELNRPAVVAFHTDDGDKFFATLTAYYDQMATLVVGDVTQTVAVDAVEKRWTGEYSLLWEAPAGYHELIGPGEEGAVIAWLDQRLAHLAGRPLLGEPRTVYDHSFVEAVQRFQFEQGLDPDGVIGPQTIIRLNTATGAAGPRLRPTDIDGGQG